MASTSIRPGPTRYRPPSLTRGRCHSRTDSVISPPRTASRNSRLNSTAPTLAAWRRTTPTCSCVSCLWSYGKRPIKTIVPLPVRPGGGHGVGHEPTPPSHPPPPPPARRGGPHRRPGGRLSWRRRRLTARALAPADRIRRPLRRLLGHDLRRRFGGD